MSAFEERLEPRLIKISYRLLDEKCFGYLQSIANMLQALSSGRWRSLPSDEQVLWLGRLQQMLTGRDSIAEVLLYDNDGALKETSC